MLYLLPGLLLAVVIACGSNSTSTVSPEPAVATNSAPDAVTEAELLEKAERALTAYIDKDWDTFLDSCARDSRPSRNVENLEQEHGLLAGSVKPEDISLTGFAVFRPTVTPLVPPEVSVEFDVNFAGKYVGGDSLIWTIENGQWVNKDCRAGHR